MEKYIYNICAIILLLTATMQSIAQTIYNDQVVINSGQLQQRGDLLYLDMQVDMTKLKVGNQQSVTFTPVLKDMNNRLELPEIIVNGSARHKEYNRAMALNKNAVGNVPYNVLKSGKDNRNIFNYSQTVPFEPWMAGASLYLKSDLCGCGGRNELSNEDLLIKDVALEVPPKQVIIAVVKPVERINNEEEKITLYFPVGMALIKKDYMENEVQLAQMDNIIKEIKANKNITITSIEIEGFASPEGGHNRNEELSRKRAQALQEHLSGNLDVPMDKYRITYGGENWNDLISMVEASSMGHKEDILSIIKNTEDVVQRKMKLERLANGRPYAQMLADFYPKLRIAICHIQYSVLSASLEGKDNQESTSRGDVIAENQQNLSFRITFTEGAKAE